MSSMVFRIVILSRKPENAIHCVQSIFDKDPSIPHEHIIIVDDGAGTDEAKAALPGVTWIKGMKPFNFSRNANIGLVYADNDAILLNDDTELVTEGGFTRLARDLHDQRFTGYSIAGVSVEGTRGEYVFPDFLQPIGRINFVCVYIPRKLYNQVGPLDERFIKYGCDDKDYCMRVKLNGFHIKVHGAIHLKHIFPRATFHGPLELNNITHWYDGDNEEMYLHKWRD